MTLTLKREPTDEGITFGKIYLDGHRTWYSLEDAIREEPGVPVAKWKVPRETAIPQGHYRVVLSQSQRFGRVLPEVLEVPGFTGIRIHAGNTEHDTEGCILVGWTRQPRAIGQSRIALGALFESIKAATDDVWIDVQNPEPVTQSEETQP